MPTINNNQIDLYYEIHGSGKPLVLIAGVGYGCWFWNKLVGELKERCKLVIFDNRGAGQSGKPEGPYTVPMLAQDTASLMDDLGLEQAAVLGHSLGGFVAQELVVRRPDLAGKLILASTNQGGTKAVPITPEALEVMTTREGDPLELIRRGIEIAAAPGFGERQPDVVQELIEYRFSNPVPPPQYQAQVAAGAGTAAFTDEQVEERLGSIQAPTLILFGEHDRVVPPENADLLAAKITDSRVVILPDTGHIFPIEDPRAAAGAILDFMA